MNAFTQRLAVDEFHRDEVLSLKFINLINVSDVRMIKRGSRFRLTNEPLHAITVRSKIGRKNLQGYFPVEFRIVPFVHLAHSALANFCADLVTAEVFPSRQTQS